MGALKHLTVPLVAGALLVAAVPALAERAATPTAPTWRQRIGERFRRWIGRDDDHPATQHRVGRLEQQLELEFEQ